VTYLRADRGSVKAVVNAGYDVGDDPAAPAVAVASNTVTSQLEAEIFVDVCNRFGIDPHQPDPETALVEHVWPVNLPKYRSHITLGSVYVEFETYAVEWKHLPHCPPQSNRGETA